MSKQDIEEMVQGFNIGNAGTFKQRVTREMREFLSDIQITRPALLKLSIHEACALLVCLMEDKQIKELKDRGEYIALRDIIAPMPRKERSDKGVPRGKREVADGEPDGELEASYKFDEETAA